MRFVVKIEKHEIFITPAFGIVNLRPYYGYNAIAIAFAWLKFKCKVEFGVKKYKEIEEDE